MLYATDDRNDTWQIFRLNTDTDAVEHVTDIIARTSYGSIVLFADNALYFQGDDERGYGTELYKFDLGTKKRQLVKNINDSTLSSDWTAAAYFDGKALVDTDNALYVTDFTKEGSLPLGAFGPYHTSSRGRVIAIILMHRAKCWRHMRSILYLLRT
jgi:hypothetical protein